MTNYLSDTKSYSASRARLSVQLLIYSLAIAFSGYIIYPLLSDLETRTPNTSYYLWFLFGVGGYVVISGLGSVARLFALFGQPGDILVISPSGIKTRFSPLLHWEEIDCIQYLNRSGIEFSRSSTSGTPLYEPLGKDFLYIQPKTETIARIGDQLLAKVPEGFKHFTDGDQYSPTVPLKLLALSEEEQNDLENRLSAYAEVHGFTLNLDRYEKNIVKPNRFNLDQYGKVALMDQQYGHLNKKLSPLIWIPGLLFVPFVIVLIILLG